MIIRIFRAVSSASAIGLILMLIALQTLTYGISASLRNVDTVFFFWVCLLAALIAWGLSKTKLNGIQAAVVMIVVGVTGIWILGARLASPLLDLGRAILSLIPQLVPAIRYHVPIDTSAVAAAWLTIADTSSVLGMRVETWLLSIHKDVTVNDALVRSMVWLLILWLVSAWMGWFTEKRKAIASLLPAIILLAAITSYSEYKVETMWLVVFVLLLLMGIWNYKNHILQWETKRIDYSDSISFDVGQSVVFLAILMGIIAFITPSVSWRQVRDFLRERNQPAENEVANVLGVQQRKVASQGVSAPKPVLPRDHLLTGGFAQSEKVVMTISTGEFPPITNPNLTGDAPRYYWRSTTYDRYESAGWITSSALPQSYEANTPLIPGLLNGYKNLHLDVHMVQPEGKLFWSGVLFSADVPFTANWRIRPEPSLFTDQAALLQADMFAASSKANSYKVESYIPLAPVEELRAASTDYPEEIQKRYLKLPASVPERVRQLARQITQDKSTAYDKAKAIETYLRSYPYDLNVPAPPQDQDVTDYFLFDLKKGYCDYYATAMVVLARASGVPARFVSGYSPGFYDAANAQYVIRELNAHSWAEVYFPQIGWVEFEPTAAQPVIDRTRLQQGSDTGKSQNTTAIQLLNRFRLEQALYWFSPLAVILVVFILYFVWIERWLYMRLTPATALERIYRRLYRLARPLAGQRTKAETIHEFQQKVFHQIDAMKGYSRFRKLLSQTQSDMEMLTAMYQGTLFRDHKIEKKDVRQAFHTWKHLRSRLWIARLILQMNSHALLTRRRSIKISSKDLLHEDRP